MITLLLDYVTFNFDAGSVDLTSVSNVLAAGADLNFTGFGSGDEPNRWVSPFGLSFRYNSGYSERPHCLQVSGVGCRKFEYSLYSLRQSAPNHISRCDFAFDVELSIDKWREFICRVFNESMFSDRKEKIFNLVTGKSKDACTIYIGSRRSPYFFRIYNKTLEQGEDFTDNYLIRYEVECKRFRRTRRGEKMLYDPSVLFDQYHSIHKDDVDLVLDEVKRLWCSYGAGFLLPENFENLDFCVAFDATKYSVLSASGDREEAIYVSSQLADEPQSWKKTMKFVVDRFGKYVPFILRSPDLVTSCRKAAEKFTGFEISIECSVDISEVYLFESDDSLFPEDDTGILII